MSKAARTDLPQIVWLEDSTASMEAVCNRLGIHDEDRATREVNWSPSLFLSHNDTAVTDEAGLFRCGLPTNSQWSSA